MADNIEWTDTRLYLLDRLGLRDCQVPDEAFYLIYELIACVESSHNYGGEQGTPEWFAHIGYCQATLKNAINYNPEGVQYLLLSLLDRKGINYDGPATCLFEDGEFISELKSYFNYLREC